MVAAGAPRMEIWYAPWEGHTFFKQIPWLDLCLIQSDRFLVDLGILEGKATLPLPATGEALTQKRKQALPQEVLQREAYIFRKTAHSKGCVIHKPNWLESAIRMTLNEALNEKGYQACHQCVPVFPQCEHHVAAKKCKICRKATP